MAIVNVDGIKIDTAFLEEYLNLPEGNAVRNAALKWQEQQAAKTRKRQPQATTTVGGVAIERRDISPLPAGIVGTAKRKTAAEQKKANDKARAAGAALPYPEAAAVETAQTTRLSPREVEGRGTTTAPEPFVPEITVRGGKEDTTTPTADIGAGAGAGAGAGGGKKTKTTVNKDQLGQQAVAQAGVTVGINQAVIQYMKENYPEDWQKIKELRDLAKQDGDISTAELARIADAFKTTTYWKNAAREKNRTTIGAYMISNGLDTISNAALIDKLTEDVYVTGVLTELEAKAQIRKEAVTKLGLTGPDADPSKIKIAQAMIDGGQSFVTAAADYVKFYTETTETPLNEFDPFEDNSFLSAFKESKSFTDFLQKVKASPAYGMSNKGRQEINGIKLRLQGLTRGLGLGYSPQQLEQQAVNISSGRETFEQLEFSLRSIAGEAFPAFKDRILAGETMESIARPYVSSMTRILELPDSAIDISDPNSDVRKALIGDGKMPKPLWQFEQDLFKDARWQYTSNARDTVDRVSMDILRRFGVMG